MSESRQQILKMLQAGKITADEAAELMDAVASPESERGAEAEDVLVGEIVSPGADVDMDRYRRFWQVPFFVLLGVTLIIGLILRSLYQSSDGSLSFLFVCVWSLFLFTFLLTTLTFLSRRSTWVHVRVQEHMGTRIAISLPIPIGVVLWGLNLGRSYAGPKNQANIEMAYQLLKATRDELGRTKSEPIMINVDDDDGDRVQVFIG